MARICPDCLSKVKYKFTTCPSCERRFVFNSHFGTNDQAWSKLIDQVSENGHYFFTLNQLYLAWQAPKIKTLSYPLFRLYLFLPLTCVITLYLNSIPYLGLGLFILLLLIPPFSTIGGLLIKSKWIRRLAFWGNVGVLVSISWWWSFDLALIPPLLLGVESFFERTYRSRLAGKDAFMQEFTRWHKAYPISSLLTKPLLQKPIKDFQESALYNYNLRKLLIVDQDLTVDFFVRNGMHKNEEISIFSLQGYPKYMYSVAQRILFEHEDVLIYVLLKEGSDINKVTSRLRQLGVKAHRIIYLGWSKKDRTQVYKHLGVQPLEWNPLLIDTLSPHALFEGVSFCLKSEKPLVHHLKPQKKVSV